jgi:hypothetical protein
MQYSCAFIASVVPKILRLRADRNPYNESIGRAYRIQRAPDSRDTIAETVRDMPERDQTFLACRIVLRACRRPGQCKCKRY